MRNDSTTAATLTIASGPIRKAEGTQQSEGALTAISMEKCIADERRSSSELRIPDSELIVIEITRESTVNHCNNILRVEEWGQRGEKVNGVVMQSRHGVREHVSCMLAHDLLNKVTSIVGFCELLRSDQTDSQKEIHLHRLRVTALLIADMLKECSSSPVTCSQRESQPIDDAAPRKPVESLELEAYQKSSLSLRVIQPS